MKKTIAKVWILTVENASDKPKLLSELLKHVYGYHEIIGSSYDMSVYLKKAFLEYWRQEERYINRKIKPKESVQFLISRTGPFEIEIKEIRKQSSGHMAPTSYELTYCMDITKDDVYPDKET